MAESVHNPLTVAEAYAEALTPLAVRVGALEDVLAELEQVLALAEQVGLIEWCDSPLVPLQRKIDMIELAFRPNVSDLTCDVLGVITQRGRMNLLGAIFTAFRRRALETMNKTLVKVSTAAPLNDATRSRMIEVLTERLGVEPVLEERVDESIIGGLIVQVGDEVFDMSVEDELDQMNRTIAQWLARMQAGDEPGPGWEAESE